MRTGLSSGSFHEILMLLKDIVELVVAPKHNEETTISGMQVDRAERAAAVSLSRFQVATKTSLCGTLSSPD